MFNYLDYPTIPKELEQHILNAVVQHRTDKTFTATNDINKAVTEAYGSTFNIELSGLANMGMFKDELVTEWVCNNITKEVNGVHVQYFENGTFFFPHVDLLRTKAVNYLLSTANAETVFYETVNNIEIKPNTMIPYNSINPVFKKIIDRHRWHELAVDKIHSVENINGIRIAITVSFV
jgi:hypothetical protein